MCGRFRIEVSADDFMVFYGLRDLKDHEYISKGHHPSKMSGDYSKGKDIYPGTESLIIQNDGIKSLKWGFPLDKKLIINGRSESVFERPLFRKSVLDKRCIVPASLFYEWNEKRKYTVKTESKFFYMAGITKVFVGDGSKPEERFLILTTDADNDMKRIHTRMPVILNEEDAGIFLDKDTPSEKIKNMLNPWNKGLKIDLSQGEQITFMDL